MARSIKIALAYLFPITVVVLELICYIHKWEIFEEVEILHRGYQAVISWGDQLYYLFDSILKCGLGISVYAILRILEKYINSYRFIKELKPINFRAFYVPIIIGNISLLYQLLVEVKKVSGSYIDVFNIVASYPLLSFTITGIIFGLVAYIKYDGIKNNNR